MSAVHGERKLEAGGPELVSFDHSPWRQDARRHPSGSPPLTSDGTMGVGRGPVARGPRKGVSSDKQGISIKPSLNKDQGKKGKRDE